ncbi:MAG: hypothetical protein NT039_02145, partial [Candidatus Berkelbacteria bacterium]|nr:hypothetical protein [Candidatus Berkelbacteria bacterium]
MKKQMILKPMKFGYRLRKYILITYYLDTLREKGNLNEAILGIQMHGVEKMFDEWNEKFLKQSIGSEDKKRLIKLTEEKNKEEQKEYLKILFNQALVMACAVLDTYLDDSIDVIISTNKKILIVLSDEKDISIPEIIEANSYKNILDKMRLKVLERFGYKGIEDRLKILKKINLNLGQALKLKTHTEEIQ